MKSKELVALIDTVFTKCREVMDGKGHDYTAGDTDRLINFKRGGNNLGVSPLTVWAVYFNKHVDSINTLVKTGKQESGEPVEGRIIDIINYALLGLALIKESTGDKMSPTERLETVDPNDEPEHKCQCGGACPPGRNH